MLEALLTRREFLVGSGAFAISPSMPSTAFAQRKISYLEALMGDDNKKQEYIDQITSDSKPNYVLSVRFVTPEILQKLKLMHKYVPPQKGVADTIPTELAKIGQGTPSEVYIFDRTFFDIYAREPHLNKIHPKPELYDVQEKILINKIKRSYYVRARLYYEGIPNFPVEMFNDSNGKFNVFLYLKLIQLITDSYEYQGLFLDQSLIKYNYVQRYANGLKIAGQVFYNSLYDQGVIGNMDMKLIGKLREEFKPEKLFSHPSELLFI